MVNITKPAVKSIITQYHRVQTVVTAHLKSKQIQLLDVAYLHVIPVVLNVINIPEYRAK